VKSLVVGENIGGVEEPDVDDDASLKGVKASGPTGEEVLDDTPGASLLCK
jgi:hypothetical protein